MEEIRANDVTQEASNICSTCGGLDNSIHICQSNRYHIAAESQNDH